MMYTFGGVMKVGGVFDKDGKSINWSGIRIMYAERREDGKLPVKADIAKAKYTDSLWQTVTSIPLGAPVELLCDPQGAVLEVRMVQGKR